MLNRFIRLNDRVKHMQYSDFYELEEIGAGGYGTVYTAKYRNYSEEDIQPPPKSHGVTQKFTNYTMKSCICKRKILLS